MQRMKDTAHAFADAPLVAPANLGKKKLVGEQIRPGCSFPAEGGGRNCLDEQHVPALLMHRVPPVDTLFVTARNSRIIGAPGVVKNLLQPTK